MSDKSGLCIICGHFVQEDDRLNPTYHTTCFAGDDAAATVSVIDAHIPSLSDANEDEISDKLVEAIAAGGQDFDAADFAIRTCRCGYKVDGFYDYIDHLKDQLREAGLIADTGRKLT